MPIRDPDLQALDRVIKLRLSRRQLQGVDQLAREFGMTRAWFLREALALGVPAAREKIRNLHRAGYRPAGAVLGRSVPGPRRGPQSDGPRTDRWVLAPDRKRLLPARPDPAYEEE